MIDWTARALQDIQEAVHHISESNERAAERVSGATFAAGESLSLFPRRGRLGKRGKGRELIVQTTPYFPVYRVRRNGDVVIDRVDWPRWR